MGVVAAGDDGQPDRGELVLAVLLKNRIAGGRIVPNTEGSIFAMVKYEVGEPAAGGLVV